MKHTNTDWVIVRDHPVFEHSVLIMSDLRKSEKAFPKGKLICKIDDIRGDSFTRLETDESEANIKLLAASPIMLAKLNVIQHYAEKAIERLNERSLFETLIILQEILKISTEAINAVTNEK